MTLALPGSPQVSSLEKAPEPEAQPAPAPEPSNQTQVLPTPTPEVSPIPEVSPTPSMASALPPEGDKVLVMMTERGFYPSILEIRLGDMVVWRNEESVRPRLTLISQEGLFPNATLDYLKIKEYRFNNSGTYNFTISEYPDLKAEIIVTEPEI